MLGKSSRQMACVVGYALTLIFFGLFTGRANPLFLGEHAAVVFPLYAHAAEIGQFSCLFLGAALAAWRPRLAELLIMPFTVAFLVGGYAITLCQAVGEGLAPWLASLAGSLFGAGQGASFLGWFLVYCRMEHGTAARSMIESTVLSGALLILVGCLSSTVALFSILSVVIALDCILLEWCMRTTRLPGDAAGGAVEFSKGLVGVGHWLRSWMFLQRRALLCLLAVAFVCGAQRVVSLEGFLPQGVTPLLFAFGYVAGALVFAATLRAEGDGDGNGYFRIYTVLLVVMATCGVFSFAQSERVQTLLYAVDNVAFTIVSMCMVMMAVGAARETPFSPLVLGGVVCGAMYFAIQAGRIVCNAVERIAGMDIVGTLVISVIIIYVIALAAVTSGAFFRQVVGSSPMGASGDKERGAEETGLGCVSASALPDDTADRPAAAPLYKTVISIAPVTEEQLRSNAVYRERFGFTDREIDTMVLLLAGYNAPDIAEMLQISVNTVKTHLKSMYAKAGVHNRRDLISLLNEVERQG